MPETVLTDGANGARLTLAVHQPSLLPAIDQCLPVYVGLGAIGWSHNRALRTFAIPRSTQAHEQGIDPFRS